MPKDVKQEEQLTPLVQDVLKYLIAAVRVVKIYPPNNPIYSQSIDKSHESLALFLESSPDFQLGVQKNYFTYRETPFSKDSQVNRAIIQDLFSKGIRDIILTAGITKEELLELYQALALSAEELAMKNGISTILWERDVVHVLVKEAGLEDIIDTSEPEVQTEAAKKKQVPVAGRTLVLGDVKTDPEAFAASMVEYAKRTHAPYESIEDRLFTLYQQASLKISKDHQQDSQALFEGLAKSMLSLEPLYRQSLINGRLYGSLDAETETEQDTAGQFIPNEVQEIRTGRFSKDWTVEQVATLLKKTASQKISPAARPTDPAAFPVTPVDDDLSGLVGAILDENPEQMETVKLISRAGMESDIIEAAVRTLISLMPRVKDPRQCRSAEKEIAMFSGVVLQLEDLLGYLLRKNNYTLATAIIQALHMPVDPEFKPRLTAALKKTATKAAIKETIADMRKYNRGTPEHEAAYAYLSSLDRKAIEVLLELLAEEGDRAARIFLLELLKDFGKNQITLLGDHLSDERWYVVRNIVSILGESRSDQALAMLRKAADHKNVKIRQEVIKALIATGGKKAAAMLTRFLGDQDRDIRLTAANALADFRDAGTDEAERIMEFLKERKLKQTELELTIAGIKALGSAGGSDAAVFLKRYDRIRWWRSRPLQEELRAAAQESIREITRRVDVGRTKR